MIYLAVLGYVGRFVMAGVFCLVLMRAKDISVKNKKELKTARTPSASIAPSEKQPFLLKFCRSSYRKIRSGRLKYKSK